MDTTIFLWTLAATFIAGLQTFVGKVVAHEKRDAAYNGIYTYGIAAIVGALGVLFGGIPAGWEGMLVFGIVSGSLHAIGNYIRIEALKHVDSVIYFPINKIIGPVLAVVSGVALFGEVISIRQYLGVALSLTVPLLLISSSERHRQNNLRKGVFYLLVSTALTVVALLLAKGAFRYGQDVMFLLLCTQTAGFVMSSLIFARDNGIAPAFRMQRRDLWLGVLAGSLGFLAYFTFLNAISRGYLSLVYVIHAHYILIPIILSVWLHEDHINARKLIAIVLSSLAIVLLYSA